jgi:hypothetical protein
MVLLFSEEKISQLIQLPIKDSFIKYMICQSIVIQRIHQFDYLLDAFGMRTFTFPT